MTAVALVSSGRRCQRKQASGQDANTRAQRIIQKHKSMLTEAIARYNGHRAALIELRQYADPAKECQFRHVELKDVFRKNTVETRRLGDSKRNEGAIYHGAGTPQPVRMQSASSTKGEKTGTFGTVATKKNKVVRNDNRSTTPQSSSTSAGDDDSTPFINHAALHLHADMEEWEKQSNRVQYFRAEADFMSWRDDREKKIADLVRHIRSCNTLSRHWGTLAMRSPRLGGRAYALEKAAMWAEMETRARDCVVNDIPILSYMTDKTGGLSNTGERYLVDGGKPLFNIFMAERAKEAKMYQGLPVSIKFGEVAYLS
ncbi:hypothetical protein FISHEDRAFT_73051 [Fistulina hepatica ATCC 64428]|uniref:Uncharacterized protein n=1 Tax=Fistulina hepatica ATCC 64428 TaxID=1128425 RepID=A0A0D7ADQ0_9AGAR|nr:hypothetical protein FISHEDRAFT_73051 [Fistulina hepatica ATCC 64428]